MQKSAILSSLVGGVTAFFDPKMIDNLLPGNLKEAPECKPFTCPEGEVAVQAWDDKNYHAVHHGCDIGKILDDVGLGQLNLYSMGMLKNAKLESCCSKYAACYASCGMSLDTCWSRFKSCANKACGGGDMFCPALKTVSGIIKDLPTKTDSKMDLNEARCSNYDRAQARHCRCVPEDDRADAIEETVKQFYTKAGQNAEVEGSKGEEGSAYEKKMAPIRERWIASGTESELFSALFTKFEKRLTKKTKRPKMELKDIPGLSKIMNNPMVRMAISQMGIDLSEFGINLSDFDVDNDGDDDNDGEEEEDDAEL